MVDVTGIMSVGSVALERFLAEGAVDKSVMINHAQTIHRPDGIVHLQKGKEHMDVCSSMMARQI